MFYSFKYFFLQAFNFFTIFTIAKFFEIPRFREFSIEKGLVLLAVSLLFIISFQIWYNTNIINYNYGDNVSLLISNSISIQRDLILPFAYISFRFFDLITFIKKSFSPVIMIPIIKIANAVQNFIIISTIILNDRYILSIYNAPIITRPITIGFINTFRKSITFIETSRYG